MTDMSETKAMPTNLSITLAMTDEIRASLRQGEGYIEVAQAYAVTTTDEAQAAASELTTIKRAITKLEDLRKGFIAPAQQIIDNARSLFNPAIKGYQDAEILIKQNLLGFTRAEEARILLENAQREEARRKAQQEAEAKAAAERAKAQEIARQKEERAKREAEARAKAEAEERAAAEAKRKAIEDGDKQAAKEAGERERVACEEAQRSAAAEAKAREQSQSAIESGDARAGEIRLQAAATSVATAPEQQTKITGFGTRENWTFRLQRSVTEDEAKKQIVAACGARPELLAFLDIDEKALRNAAKTYKKAFNVPGYEAFNDPIAAGSRK